LENLYISGGDIISTGKIDSIAFTSLEIPLLPLAQKKPQHPSLFSENPQTIYNQT
jgi:hypothetical protein